MGDATRLGAGTAAARDTLARAVARRHACVKAAVKAPSVLALSATPESLGRWQIAARTGAERHMSLKLNTSETQVKLLGFKAPGLERTAQVHLVRGVQSEREVTWDFGPADVNLGLAEMLRGRMLRSVRGCKNGRWRSRPPLRLSRPVRWPLGARCMLLARHPLQRGLIGTR